VDRPTLWFAYGPLVLGWAIPLLYAVRVLATEARRGASALGRPARVQWAAVALVLLPAALLAGHLEDLIAITLVALAARSALRTDTTRGAIWLVLAIVTKQWSLLAAPALFAIMPAGSRIRWLAIAAGIPGVVFGGLLLADPDGVGRALFEGLAFPAAGHPALFVDPSEPLVGTPSRVAIVIGLAMTVLHPWEPGSPAVWWVVQGALFLLLAAPAVRDLIGPRIGRGVAEPVEQTS
jgi:hypothetical protein